MLVLKLRCSKRSSYTGSPSPSPQLVEEAPISKHLHISDRINVFVMDVEENEARNSRAGDNNLTDRPTFISPVVSSPRKEVMDPG
jgi:hypothetical protein